MRAVPFAVAAVVLFAASHAVPAVAEALTQPTYVHRTITIETIPMDDGVALRATVVRPVVPDGVLVPVVVQASPYLELVGPQHGADYSNLVSWFVPRGYAIAFVALRGTGGSEGCLDFGGVRDQADLLHVIEHYGTASWSNGNVALFGGSYDGTMALAAAIHAPPHLKTIVPIAALTDWYGWMYYEGAPYLGAPVYPSYYALPTYGAVRAPGDDGACSFVTDAVPAGFTSSLDGAHAGFFDDREYARHFGNVTASVFFIQGLDDRNVKPNHAAAFAALTGPKKAWIGQWAHEVPDSGYDRHSSFRRDWMPALNAWFDQFLLGLPSGALDGPTVEVEDTTGRWRSEDDWPPPRAEDLKLWFRPGTTIGIPRPGTLGAEPGPSGTFGFVGVPGDAPRADARSKPLPEPLHLSGGGSVTLTLTRHTEGEGRLAVTLFTEGIGARTEINRGFLNLRQWQGRETSELPPVGVPFNVTIPLYPLDIVVPAGARLAVGVAGDDRDWLSPGATAQQYTLHVGEGSVTAVTLKVLPEANGGWLG